MFDLKTYCGSYSSLENITFLSGYTEIDTQAIKKTLNKDEYIFNNTEIY
jgi:hypothetical protein